MILTNCNCEHEVDCGCVLSFDEYVANSLSVLSVGNLLGGDCEFEEYVIDWYRNGEHALVSGVGSDPDIQAYHPFLGLASIPVLPGTWVPVVRYVVIDGEIIFSVPKKCKSWCADLSNLPVIIVVSPLNCNSTNSPVNPGYSYRLSYVSSQDFSMAERLVLFQLPTDLSAKYFAFVFNAALVSDKIEIYFNEETIPLTSWIVGTGHSYPADYSEMPYVHRSGFIDYIITLPDYVSGDYLIIKITPSVFEFNVNTNWQLDIKCLGIEDFGCDYATKYMQQINSVSMFKNVEACMLELTITMEDFFGVLGPSHPMYLMYRYGGLRGISSGSSLQVPASNQYVLRKDYSKTVQTTSGSGALNPTSLVNAAALVYITKVGSLTTIQCTDINDYNSLKAGYEAVQLTSIVTTFENDNTSLKYYRFYVMYVRETLTSCGDTYAQAFSAYFHLNSTFVFDDVNMKVEITSVEIVLGITPEECDGSYSLANTYANSYINTYHNMPDYSVTTICRQNSPLGYVMGPSGVVNPSVPYQVFMYGTYLNHLVLTPCGELPLFCFGLYPHTLYQIFYHFYLRLEFSDDPWEENYRIRAGQTDDGCVETLDYSTWPIIYEVVAGAVVTNLLPFRPIP